MYKTIICAIEASQEGKSVLAKASELSKKYGGRLIVMHVIPYTLLPKDYQKDMKEKVGPKIEKMAAEYGIGNKDLVVKIGKPYETICKEAKKRKADLVVVGTHSKKGLGSLLGSTANGVVNYAPCDVSLIKV